MSADAAAQLQCPCCRGPLQGWGIVDGVRQGPAVGDFCVCIHCAANLTFHEGRKLRRTTLSELQAAPPATRVQLAIASFAVERLRRQRAAN